jgi:hypothetical protein
MADCGLVQTLASEPKTFAGLLGENGRPPIRTKGLWALAGKVSKIATIF